MNRSLLLTCIMVPLLFGSARGQDWKSRVKASPSIEQIRSFYQKFEKFGKIHESEIKVKDVEYFVIWIQGAEVSQVFLWAYRRSGPRWILEVDYAGDVDEEMVWGFSNKRFERRRIAPPQPNPLLPESNRPESESQKTSD